MQSLNISLIQSNLYWGEKQKNLDQFQKKIESVSSQTHVILLPEMFSTGFIMQPEKYAEAMDGLTMEWLKKMASSTKKIITGSLIIKESEAFYNRLIWMLPNETFYFYDKRHLFGYAGEHKHYSGGNKKLIVQVNGWKICTQICYDLRFPVWSRQQNHEESSTNQYDMLLYVANWPESRNHAWITLLQARAIENQCFVAAVNRVGKDGNDIYHAGNSCFINPLGEIISKIDHEESILLHSFDKDELINVRAKYPFLNDADKFLIL